MVSKAILEQIDYSIKKIWKYNISKDYFADHILKEDSLKCCFYYHLRRKLAKLLQDHHLRIYPEYYFPELGFRADLAIVQIDPNQDYDYLGDSVTDVLAIVEFKYTYNSSDSSARQIKKDISKIKTYLQTGKLVCQCYLGIIYEVECTSLIWMDKRSTNNWARGYVTELDAGYRDGVMKFEVNSYNGLNEEINSHSQIPKSDSDWNDPYSLVNRWLNDPNPVGVVKGSVSEKNRLPEKVTIVEIDSIEEYLKEREKNKN